MENGSKKTIEVKSKNRAACGHLKRVVSLGDGTPYVWYGEGLLRQVEGQHVWEVKPDGIIGQRLCIISKSHQAAKILYKKCLSACNGRPEKMMEKLNVMKIVARRLHKNRIVICSSPYFG